MPSVSQAARYQIYQTRAKMSATLWINAILAIVSVWLGITIWVVHHETGQLHYQYWWWWMIGGVVTRTPLLNMLAPHLPMRADGQWYRLVEFTAWLDQLYHGPFTDYFWRYAIRTALIPIGIAAFAIVWKVRHRVDAEHLRGLRLLTPREHRRQLNGGVITRLYHNGSTVAAGIVLGASVIPEHLECQHTLITGSPGSGKSTLIRAMLKQVQERGQCAVVIDPDAEFLMEFYNPGRGDVVLNPLDGRCPFWSPWLEFRDDSFTMDAEAMAASLIRGQARTPTEEFFRSSSRTLIEAMFTVVTDRSSSAGINNFLALPRKDIQTALSGTRAYPLIDPGAHEQGSGILATAANAVKPFFHLPTREQTGRTWSAREWAQSPKGWVFLSSTEDGRDAIQSLQGVWLDALVRWLMTAEIGSDQVWIMADELPAMGYQNQIEKLTTRGRKRGLAVVMGFQNVSQLRSIYGRDGAVTLTSAPTTKVILRVDEAETAKWASELLGGHETERMQQSQLAGLSTYREGITISAHRSIEHLVLPAEIQMLRPFTGYLCIAGHDRTTIQIPERHLEKHHPAFIPRQAANTNNNGHGTGRAVRRGWSA